MDRSRKATRAGAETTFQYRSRNEQRLEAELIEDKLAQLIAFIEELQVTRPEVRNFSSALNYLVNAKEVLKTLQPSSMRSCIIGWKESFRRRNHHCTHRDKRMSCPFHRKAILPANLIYTKVVFTFRYG